MLDILLKLGIDPLNVVYYVVNFGLLAFLLWYYAYGPIIKMIEHRRDTIRKNLTEAETLREEIEGIREKAKKEAQKVRKELDADIAKAKLEISKEKEFLLKEAHDEADKILLNANKRIEEKEKKLISEIEEKLISTMKEVVKYVVSHDIPSDVLGKSVENAWEKFSKK